MAVADLMQRHFHKGVSPKPYMINRATITKENMKSISFLQIHEGDKLMGEIQTKMSENLLNHKVENNMLLQSIKYIEQQRDDANEQVTQLLE